MPGLITQHPPAADAPLSSATGPEQGVIEEARRRQRQRRIRATIGGLLAAVIVTGFAWALTAGGSPRHSHQAGRGGAGQGRAPAAAGFNVRLSPALNGGQYGWCVGVEERAGAIGGGGCSMTPVTSMPLAIDLSIGSRRTRQESIVIVTTPPVAAILVNGGRRVPTVALPLLPYGLRAARILIPIQPGPSAPGRPKLDLPTEPTLVALDAQGQPIPNRIARERAEPANVSGRGPCTLHSSGLPGLAPQWSHVANAIRPFPGKLVGRAFFSCIDTEYYLKGWPLDAAVLLDAAHPGTTPAAIPGLVPVRESAGFFNGPGDFKGELTATRFGNSWLVVAGGSSLAQRIQVLRHLTATIKL